MTGGNTKPQKKKPGPKKKAIAKKPAPKKPAAKKKPAPKKAAAKKKPAAKPRAKAVRKKPAAKTATGQALAKLKKERAARKAELLEAVGSVFHMPNYAHVFKGFPKKKEAANRFWDEIIDHLLENMLVTKKRLFMADRYVRARVEWEDLYQKTMKDGPVVKTKNGNKQFSYEWAAREKVEERLLKFEVQLLITPLSQGMKLERKRKPVKDAASSYGA